MTGVWAALPIPALLINAQGCIAAVNPAAEDFLNLSARSFLGLALSEKLGIKAPMDGVMARVRKSQSAIAINDIEVTTAERATVQCRLQIAPMHGTGDLLLLISPLEITDRLGRAAAVKTAAKSAIGMAEMLAHEIKNPLAGISGAAQLLAMTLSPQDRELSDLIVLETRRIVKLLEQVEQFGNLRPPERRAVNLHGALDRARRSAVAGFARDLVIEVDYDPSLPDTFADEDQLMQVFLNLIKNAAEAGARVIRLRTFYDLSLRLRHQDGSGSPLALQIEIIDDGPGIPADIAGSLFDPFVSGRENGTGLGLALVSKIVLDHEGWIAVDQGQGRTVFRLSLPLVPKARVTKG